MRKILNFNVRARLFRARQMAPGAANVNCDDQDLPDQEPVRWREINKLWSGPRTFRFKCLTSILGLLLLFFSLIVIRAEERIASIVLSSGLFLWVGMVLLLITRTAGLIALERGHGTLDVLLTTPISSREIIAQKTAGVRRLVWFCIFFMILFLTLRIIDPSQRSHVSGRSNDLFTGPLTELTMVLIYPQAIVWMTVYFSLRSRTTVIALVKSIGSLVILSVAPWLILACIVIGTGGLSREYFTPIMALLVVGPANLLLYEYGFGTIPPGFEYSFYPAGVNSIVHVSLWLVLRQTCLIRADVLLGRSGQQVLIQSDSR